MFEGFTKQSLSIGANGFKKLHKQICAKNAPKKDEFLKKTQWLKKNEVDELYMCAAMAIKNSKYINEHVDNDDQIQQGELFWLKIRKSFEFVVWANRIVRSLRLLQLLGDSRLHGHKNEKINHAGESEISDLAGGRHDDQSD